MALSRDFDALKQVLESISPLTDAAWLDISSCFTEQSLAEYSHFIQAGESAQDIAFVTEGVLREYFITVDGKEFNKAFVGAGTFTGSLYDLLSQLPSTASIQALSPVRLYRASFQSFRALFDIHPCCERFGRLFAERLFMKKAKREYELMCLDATARYQLLLQQLPTLESVVAQYHIASYLGITPVALSRIRKELKQTGGEPI